jgi:hypothetical protein
MHPTNASYKCVPEYIDQLYVLALALHIADRNKQLDRIPGPVQLVDMPKSATILSDACTWMSQRDFRISRMGGDPPDILKY